jgi:hypothetical protein
MGTHNGAVDHRVFVIGISREMLEDALPDTGFGPAAMAAVYVLPISEALGQVAPWNAGPIAVEHRLHKQPVVGGGDADGALPTGQHIFDPSPWSSRSP